ncbi:MAG: hypothetical protein PIR53_15110 [Nocardioides alkalitolerans]
MVDIDTLLSWKPTDLSAVGDRLNEDRRTLLDLQDEVDDGYPPSTWTGDGSTSARTNHTRLRDDLNDLVAEIAPVITAIDTAASTILAAQQKVEAARQTIAARGWLLSTAGGQVRADPPAGAEEGDGDREAVQGAVDEITTALSDAQQADADLAAVLGSAESNQYDGGTGTLSDAGLPPHLQGLSESELVDYFMEHPEETAPYVDQLSTQQQQALGESLAGQLERLNYGDWNYGEQETDPEDWLTDSELAQLNAQLAAFGHNSTVATTALNQIGPETYLELQQNLLMPHGDQGTEPPTVGTMGESQRQLGALLAAGTSGITADGQAGSTTHVAESWVDTLVDHASSTDYNYNWGTDTVNGLQLLGVAAGEPGHGSYFLNRLGSEVERYEVEYMAENGGHPWNQWSTGPDARLDYTAYGADDSRSWEDFMYDDRLDPGTPSGFDPMAGVFEGMSHNPDAARDFLSGDPYVAEGQDAPANRIDYYLNDREWDISPHEDEWVTGMRHFGDALVSATTESPTPVSADLAEQAVTAAQGGALDDYPSLQRDYSTILGAYMPDVYDAFSGPGAQDLQSQGDTNPWLPGEQTADMRARFSEAELRDVLQQVGQDETAGQNLTGAATLYANYGYDAVFSGAVDAGAEGQDLTGQWNSRLDNAISSVNSPFADVVGSLGEGYSEHLRAEGLRADQEASNAGDGYWQAGGYVANKLAGEIPFVGAVAPDVVDLAVDGITGLNDVDTTNEVRADIGSYVYNTEGALQGVAEGAVYRNLPVDYLQQYAPELVGPDGRAVPMNEWTQAQADAWAGLNGTSGPGGVAGQLSSDLADQLDGSASQTERQDGN